MKLLEQVKVLERAVSQQCGEREELLGHLNQIKEDCTSADQNTESMVGKIQVRREFDTKLVIVCCSWGRSLFLLCLKYL